MSEPEWTYDTCPACGEDILYGWEILGTEEMACKKCGATLIVDSDCDSNGEESWVWARFRVKPAE